MGPIDPMSMQFFQSNIEYHPDNEPFFVGTEGIRKIGIAIALMESLQNFRFCPDPVLVDWLLN